jgi:MOSC domain-containing protein YiiM
MSARIFQLNASSGGVPKLPIREATIRTNGLDGDVQKNKMHGGPTRAVCLFSLEVILALQSEGHPIYPGSIGENVTITGLPWTSLAVGQRWALGDEVILALVEPTNPCKNIAASFIDGNFRRVDHPSGPDKQPLGWSRWYASVERGGRVRVGDPIARLLL